MRAFRLGLDMDGPMADFDVHFWNRCIEQNIRFVVDGPEWQTERYFTEHIPDPDERAAARAMVDAPGWFRELPVTPGAHEGVERLLVDPRIDLVVVTKPLAANPECASEKLAWTAEHFPDLVGRVIVVDDKSYIDVDVLLDDAPYPEWFAVARWSPVIFPAPFNRNDPRWDGLPRWAWGDSHDRLLAAASA